MWPAVWTETDAVVYLHCTFTWGTTHAKAFGLAGSTIGKKI